MDIIKTTHLKDIYYNITNDNIDKLISYFRDIGGKELKVSLRRQYAFKTKWKDKEKIIISRCHVQNAAEYIESIKEGCSQNQVEQVIVDIVNYVAYLDRNEDVSFVFANTNILPSAIHFTSAEHLFYNHNVRNDYQTNNDMDLVVIYLLRLSLESRIKGLLGVDTIKKGKKGESSNVGLFNLIEICEDLKTITYSENVNWMEIKWINNWLNHFMHRNMRPYPWVIFQSIKALEEFINPKEPVYKNGSKIYSLYSATYVKDENIFHDEVKDALTSKYPDIQIRWLHQREILK